MGKAKQQGYKNAKDRQQRRSYWFGFWGLIATIVGFGYAVTAPEPSPFVGSGIFTVAFVLALFAWWEHSRLRKSTKITITLVMAAAAIIGGYRWIVRITMPSFVFVKPGIWLEDGRWVMVMEHGGTRPVYNIEAVFSDQDRLAAFRANPSDLILISGADLKLRFDELDPNGAISARSFTWPPLNADHEHYSVDISTRDMRMVETLNIERVGGKWDYAVKLTDDTNRIVLFCRDADFPISTEWPAALSPCFPDFKPK